MFERVESTPKPYRPSAGKDIPSVHVMPDNVSVPVRKSSEPRLMEMPAPQPQKADLRKIPGRKKMWIILSIVISVLIIGIGGTFAAYRMGYIDIPILNKIFLDKDVLASAASNVLDIESGEIEMTLAIAVEDKTDKAVLLTTPDSDGFGPRQIVQAAQIRSDVGQYRTGLSLYYDYNQLTYPNNLDELIGDYLSVKPEPPTDQSSYEFEVGDDRKTYMLTGTMIVGDSTYEYSIDNEGTITDTFPKNATTSLFDDEEVYNGMLDGLPLDFMIEGRMYSFVGKEQGEEKQRDALVALSGKYGSSGTTLELDLESRAKDGTTYFKLNKFPSLFLMDAGNITGQWIEAPSIEELDDSYLGILDYSDITNIAGGTATSSKEIRTLATYVVEQAIAQSLIGIDRKLPTERVEGKLFDKYALSFNLDQLDEALIGAQKKMDEYCGSNTCEIYGADDFDEEDIREAIEEIIGPENSLMTQFFDAGEYILWVDRDGDGYRLEINMYLGFPDDVVKLSNKQLHLSTSIMLDHINDEPDVKRPDDAVDWGEAQRLMSGLTENEWRYEKQIDAVSSLRTSLSGYFADNDEYPDSLTALLTPDAPSGTGDSAHRVFKLAQVTIKELPMYDEYEDAYYQLNKIPEDSYTGKPFSYKKTDGNYELVYELKLEDKPESASGFYGIDSYGSYGDYFSDGTNTADKYVVSREAIWEKDTDTDGLSGKEEYDHKTDPTRKDTDSDGTSDFEEIQGGTDPLDAASKPVSATPTPKRVITIPTVSPGTISPNTGNVNGGPLITLGFANAKDDVAVYFGSRRAYIRTHDTISLGVILPGHENPLTTGVSEVANIKIVNNGHETTLGTFTYTGGVVVDSDSDGLPDAEELAIGTSKNLEDSDQDGYSDYTEVNSGHDPLFRVIENDIPIEKQVETQMFSGTEGSMTFWTKAEDWDLSGYANMVNFIDDNSKERLLIRKGINYLTFIVYSDNPANSLYSYDAWSANDISWVDDQWMHIGITWKQGEVVKLYVNGVPLSNYIEWQSTLNVSSSTTDALTSTGSLYLQGRKIASDGLNVEVEDFSLSNSVISPSALKSEFDAGK